MSRFSATALLFAAVLALCACGKKAPPQQAQPPAEVGVVAMHPQTLPLTRELVGRLSAFRSSDVRARVPGSSVQGIAGDGAT